MGDDARSAVAGTPGYRTLAAESPLLVGDVERSLLVAQRAFCASGIAVVLVVEVAIVLLPALLDALLHSWGGCERVCAARFNRVLGPVAPLAIIAYDPPTLSGALALVDPTTGAVVRRGAPVFVGPPGFFFLTPSPDTQHALILPSGFPSTTGVLEFDVATVAGAPLSTTDLVQGATWSHDGTRLCETTATQGKVLAVTPTGPGTPLVLWTAREGGGCSWSFDDAAIAWFDSAHIDVTSAASGPAVEVSGATRAAFGVEPFGWSPTEERLAFGVLETTGWRTFTVLVPPTGTAQFLFPARARLLLSFHPCDGKVPLCAWRPSSCLRRVGATAAMRGNRSTPIA